MHKLLSIISGGSKYLNSIFYIILKSVICDALFVFLPGCNDNSQFTANVVANEPTRSAWLVYWDLDAGEKDLRRTANKLEKLSYFSAYFDENDHIFIPQELNDKKSELKKQKGKYQTYLTFVNDKQNLDGSVTMKDIEVLRRLFVDDAAMEQHIDEVIALTLLGGYDGIEIDYERIWKEENIGQLFIKFTNKLYAKALNNNLQVRLVLEPNTPFSDVDFVNGPEYVVMFYNLYGLHSAPGPKANKDFIQKTLIQMQALPGEKSVAFATGGCMWGDNGEKILLTEIEAKTFAAVYDVEAKRDEDSQCVVFDYQDADSGVQYQVWYADIKTLNYWTAVVQEQGENNISMWRLGGNIDIDKIE